MKVRATDEFKKMGLHPEELKDIPEIGFEFEVSAERFKVLSGANQYGINFVEKVEEIETAKKENKAEKAIKRTTKKSK